MTVKIGYLVRNEKESLEVQKYLLSKGLRWTGLADFPDKPLKLRKGKYCNIITTYENSSGDCCLDYYVVNLVEDFMEISSYIKIVVKGQKLKI